MARKDERPANRPTMAAWPYDDGLHAFIEDRKEHVANTILAALEEGPVVLLDRNY